MMLNGDAIRDGACGASEKSNRDTANPVNPARGSAPRPVAPSSRISPPEPVAAPGNGEMAVGWLWVSALSTVCTV